MAGDEGSMASDMVLVVVGVVWWVDKECGDWGIKAASMIL